VLELTDEATEEDSELKLELMATLELLDISLLELDKSLLELDSSLEEDTVLETATELALDELELLLLSPPQAVSNPATDRAMNNEIGFMTSAPQKEGDASLCAISDIFVIKR